MRGPFTPKIKNEKGSFSLAQKGMPPEAGTLFFPFEISFTMRHSDLFEKQKDLSLAPAGLEGNFLTDVRQDLVLLGDPKYIMFTSRKILKNLKDFYAVLPKFESVKIY